MKRWKTKTMAAKCHKNKGGISLSIKKEKNYKRDIADDTDLDHADDKYLLQH